MKIWLYNVHQLQAIIAQGYARSVECGYKRETCPTRSENVLLVLQGYRSPSSPPHQNNLVSLLSAGALNFECLMINPVKWSQCVNPNFLFIIFRVSCILKGLKAFKLHIDYIQWRTCSRVCSKLCLYNLEFALAVGRKWQILKARSGKIYFLVVVIFIQSCSLSEIMNTADVEPR